MVLEALPMRWLKRNPWKTGIALAGLLLLLIFMVWIPVSAAGVYERASGFAGSVTVQATPTEDATVAALNKEKLVQEVQQLKEQNEPDPLGWLRTNLSVFLSTLVVVIGGLVGYLRWLRDRRDELEKRRQDQRSEREKRAEERFQSAVTGLVGEKEGAMTGAAILLRTFLRPGYEQFYTQTFDLSVANLCPTETPNSPEDPKTPLPLTRLRQALIVVFKEAFPLSRGQNKGSPQSLDASYIQLDNAYLLEADLKQAWMPQASLREAFLSRANLKGAYLNQADLRGAYLIETDLSEANLFLADLSSADLREANLSSADLREANLSSADLSSADLREANLSGANLSSAKLSRANLSGANLSGAGLSGAKLTEAHLSKANLSRADLRQASLGYAHLTEADLSEAHLSKAYLMKADLSGADLSEAHLDETNLREADLSGADLREANLGKADLKQAKLSETILKVAYLKAADLRKVTGLTKEQLETCKAWGAIIDEDPMASASQSTVTAPSLSQSNDVQASSAPGTDS